MATEFIYLDYAATTPVDPLVADVMSRYLTAAGTFANPTSLHAAGQAARAAVEAARAQVAVLAGASPGEIVFTSGATESDNIALAGVARFYRDRGRHIVTARSEHKAVLDTCRALSAEGFSVTYLDPDANGLIAPDALAAALRGDTVVASIMHVNNETGVIQDLAGLGGVCRERGVFFHTDAAQAAGKVALDYGRLPVDLASFSAQKVYGPKGIGALFVSAETNPGIRPLMVGGGQERGIRPGTLATHQIAGIGAAFEIAGNLREEEHRRIAGLSGKLAAVLERAGAVQNVPAELRVPHILNMRFPGVTAESLIFGLPGFGLSAGAACAGSGDASYVLTAMGLGPEAARGSLRLSLGRHTTAADIDAVAEALIAEYGRLKRISAVPETA